MEISWKYNHIAERSTIHYLTAVNKSPKEIHDKIKLVYDEGCTNIQNIWRAFFQTVLSPFSLIQWN